MIYTDNALRQNIEKIEDELKIKTIIRDREHWDFQYVIQIMTNPSLNLIVINTLDERSIIEISIAMFMCKKVLVTTKAIQEYKYLQNIVDFIEQGADLAIEGSTFIDWYKYSLQI